MDISMDIHEKSVDMDMDMDAIFHIHGNPVYLVPFLGYSMSKNVVTLKSGSEVIQGHRKWYHSIDRVWFPISIL